MPTSSRLHPLTHGMVLPMALLLCSLLGVLTLMLWQGQHSLMPALQAQQQLLRTRERAWLGLQAALRDVHAPRQDARHPPADMPRNPSWPFIPVSLNDWPYWLQWQQQQSSNACVQGLCVEQTSAQQPAHWLSRQDGIALTLPNETSTPIMYWIEPLLMQTPDSSLTPVFRLTVRVGTDIWQGWWKPNALSSGSQTPSEPPDGQWLSLLRLITP